MSRFALPRTSRTCTSFPCSGTTCRGIRITRRTILGPIPPRHSPKSYDGVHFTNLGKGIGDGAGPGTFDDRMATFSSVFKDEVGVYHLVYEAGRFHQSVSGTSRVCHVDRRDQLHQARGHPTLRFVAAVVRYASITERRRCIRKTASGTSTITASTATTARSGLAVGTDLMSMTRVSTEPIIPYHAVWLGLWDDGEAEPADQAGGLLVYGSRGEHRPARTTWPGGQVESSAARTWSIGKSVPRGTSFLRRTTR